jgi:hypothetical protein
MNRKDRDTGWMFVEAGVADACRRSIGVPTSLDERKLSLGEVPKLWSDSIKVRKQR